jgi:purine-cytosine permease-like protein
MAENTIETYGVDSIPESARTSRPRDIITMLLGGNLSLSVMVFGWLAILYGLDLWGAVTAIIAGTAVGAALVAATSLLGYRSATNNSVTSGAFFGVQGRLVASAIGLLICLQYSALTVWTGGDAIAAGIARLTGQESSTMLTVFAYALIAVLIVTVAVYGYRWLLKLNTVLPFLMAIVMLLVVFAWASSFDLNYAGVPEELALGDYWPTWLLAAITAGAAGPISYVTLTGDWSRYISPDKHSPRAVVLNTFVGLFLGNVIPCLFGVFVSVIAFDVDSFAGGFVAGAPTALLIPIVLLGLLGSLGQGGLNLYSMGLDLDAIFPRFSRIQSTLFVALISVILVFLGRFVFDLEAAVTNTALFLTSLASAWAAIAIAGYIRQRGEFDCEDLQVFNRRQKGGKYWFRGGWSLKTTAAWLLGSAAGITGISTVDYVGPLAEKLAYVDVSVPASIAVATLAYLAFDR